MVNSENNKSNFNLVGEHNYYDCALGTKTRTKPAVFAAVIVFTEHRTIGGNGKNRVWIRELF